jgi:hypothetical protein
MRAPALQALDAHENDVHGVGFSPDGKWMRVNTDPPSSGGSVIENR